MRIKDRNFISVKGLKSEFERLKNLTNFSVKQIPFSQLDSWHFEEDSGNIVHSSGKFFRIEGLRIETNFRYPGFWEQPIINQPEIGILGIVTKIIGGVRYFLMQAKVEPGNVNIFQLSPTVQATKSNYTQVHKGKQPLFLDFFLNGSKAKILVDQLQSEQGAKFLRKRNRNVIVEIDQEINLPPNFYWLTLRQIKELLAIDNFVNMDARSVLSCFPLTAQEGDGIYTKSQIASWIQGLRSKYKCQTESIALKDVRGGWHIDDWQISHESRTFFSIIAVSVKVEGREVRSWSQPLLKPSNIGMVGFLTKRIKGVLHALVQAKVEPGYINTCEMAPTVSYSDPEQRLKSGQLPPFAELFIKATPEQIKSSVIFSEEGGRFYHSQNRYMIIEVGENEELEIPSNYIWMTFDQLLDFTGQTSLVSVEARTLLSCR
ncbi:MAG: NDP-hexose 2,3-dehydratase family protein [Candidatus Omnitrophica bacterium]|nr:NDP-hexose 2,3-dehydratase family protein [Candidatus Omnitrophota bacterium]